MANIKFSQFTVGNTESDIDFVVGYKGANNIQISPANLLAASLSGYLPLAGGTMTGTSGIHMPDNFALKAGNSQDFQIFHSGSQTIISQQGTGNLIIQNTVDDADIEFKSDNNSGGTATYFYLDGSEYQTRFLRPLKLSDDIQIRLGTGNDLRLQHSSGNNSSYIQNYTGELYIENLADDKDIIFKSDDGSGGTTTYFFLDGSRADGTYLYTEFPDNSVIGLGNDTDLQIYHTGTASVVENYVGDLIIQQKADDKDIMFKCDNGSGGVIDYFKLDGSLADGNYTYTTRNDGGVITFGNSLDLRIWRDPSLNTSYIRNYNDNFIIENLADDKDIIFNCDDGAGGVTTYFFLDGSKGGQGGGRLFTKFPDNSTIAVGSDALGDLQIYHDGTTSNISNINGNLSIINQADDGDIKFFSDDGSGGVTEYFRLDGGNENVKFSKLAQFLDDVQVMFGNGGDLKMYHNSTSQNGIIENFTNDLIIQNNANDEDIVFKCDDGSGGITEYFRVDGSSEITIASKPFRFNNAIAAQFGTNFAMQIYHSGGEGTIQNLVGDLRFIQDQNDGDIKFICDDGSGGTDTYFYLDGGNTRLQFNKNARFIDNAKIMLGNSDDLEIYHDGSNSYIKDAGTGSLKILAQDFTLRNAADTASMITGINGGSVFLYHNGSEKLKTKSTGINISGVSEYADNTAAIAGGLTTGDVYRTGDLLKIVH